ncbi:UNVERIFIED_CONTAM: hypothetical protein PYX00_003186 [Menopon gallinae]|uniref:Reverse transcriptase n=1 Tax=Menopon gallinae TaxID=328185 RepID=A0AAW2I0Q4_9NEOP
MFKLIQINLNRARAAHDILEQESLRTSWDVGIISEPNAKRSETPKWTRSKNGSAAIWFPNPRLTVGARGSGISHAWAVVDDLIIISAYISPNISDEEVANILTDIICLNSPTHTEREPEENHRWDVRRLNQDLLKTKLQELIHEGALEDTSPDNFVHQICKICDVAMPKLRTKKNRNAYWWNGTMHALKRECLREQRRLGLCICRGFRTVATDVVLVLARMIPLDLLIREAGCRETSKKERREATMRCWEARWRGGTETGKAANGRCSECPDREDTPEHAWDDCPLWTPERMRLRDLLTEVPKYWTVVDEMLRCKRRWEAISSTMNAIVAKKSRITQMPR